MNSSRKRERERKEERQRTAKKCKRWEAATQGGRVHCESALALKKSSRRSFSSSFSPAQPGADSGNILIHISCRLADNFNDNSVFSSSSFTHTVDYAYPCAAKLPGCGIWQLLVQTGRVMAIAEASPTSNGQFTPFSR